jgi:DNA-binding HxlR family transcriptional regulator
MPKLTREQKRFLIWLSLTGTHFEICRELGYSYRQMNGLERYVNKQGERYKFDMRTLNKLVNEGLVTSKILYPYGIKQVHYFVTEEGRAYAYQVRTAVS